MFSLDFNFLKSYLRGFANNDRPVDISKPVSLTWRQLWQESSWRLLARTPTGCLSIWLGLLHTTGLGTKVRHPERERAGRSLFAFSYFASEVPWFHLCCSLSQGRAVTKACPVLRKQDTESTFWREDYQNSQTCFSTTSTWALPLCGSSSP